MSEIVNFLDSPLVTWVKTFGDDEPVAFQDLCDGVFFNDVLLQIDQRELEANEKINRSPTDQNARLQNWNILIKNIKSFYHDVLQQTVVSTNPNIFALVDEPSKDGCLEDMEKIMLLLLGCAVQCERKAFYIDKIMSLEISTQQAIVQWIRQVTDTPDHVVSPDMISADSDIAKQIYIVLKRVVQERDQHFQDSVILKQEKNYFMKETEKKKGHIAPPPTLEKYHMARELQEYKTQLITTMEELEEKGRTIADLKTDLRNQSKDLGRLKSENMALSKDANLARLYRDELDSMKEQAMKVEKLEKEVCKYKEKIHEMEYFKTRVEELKEDNSILSEAKQKLDNQFIESQKRADTIMQDLLNLQSKMDDLKQEKEEQQKKLEEALEENAALDFERTRAKEGYGGPLRRMISYTSSEFLHGSNLQLSGHPISEELSDSMHSHVTKLELENNQLKTELEEIKSKLHDSQVELENLIEQSEKDFKRRRQEFEKEQTQLRMKITNEVTNQLQRNFDSKIKDLQENARSEKQQIVQDYDAKVRHLDKENKDIKQQLDEVKQSLTKEKDHHVSLQQNKNKELFSSYENQIRQLKLENDELVKKLDQLSKSNQTTFNGQVMPSERGIHKHEISGFQSNILEQKRHMENELQVKVHHLQREKEDLHDEIETLQEELGLERDKYETLMLDCDRLEKERDELKQNVETIRECSENHIKSLEQELSNLQTKAVAMENLNDYLSNLSTADENVFLQNDEKYGDENHNTHDISRESLRSLPADLSQIAMRNTRNRSIKQDSFCSEPGSEHDYAEIPSFSSSFMKGHRGEKINYVKGTPSSKENKPRQESTKSSGLFGKLKSYVKPSKEVDGDQRLRKSADLSSKTHRMPLQEVEMKERPAFDRNSKHRHTIQNIHMRESGPHYKPTKMRTPVVQSHSKPVPHSFSRDHALRRTMPEKRTTYRFPEKRSTHSRNSSQQSLLSQDGQRQNGHSSESRHSRRNHSGTNCRDISVDDGDFHDFKVPPPNPYHAHCEQGDCCTSDFDSGFAQSAENSPPNKSADVGDQTDSSQPWNKHKLTSIEILSTETVKRRFSTLSSSSNNALIQQIVKLQDHNIELSSENTELRKSMDSLKLPDGNDGSLASRFAKLEAENRKLKMIIETLQYTLSGRNPYDKTEYHYFTNV